MRVGGQRHAPANIYPRKRPGTHFIGGWVGPRTGLDLYGKSRLHRNSIPGPPSPQRIAIQTELPGPQQVLSLKLMYTKYQSHSPQKTHCGSVLQRRPYLGPGRWSPAGHRGRPASNQGQSVFEFWCTKWYWGSASAITPYLPQCPSTDAPFTFIHLSGTLHNVGN